MTQHGHEGTLFDGQIHAVEDGGRCLLRVGIGEMQIFDFDDSFAHSKPFLYLAVQRVVTPQGRARPVSVTGRPSS